MSLEPILSPSLRIASALGPMKVTPEPLAQVGERRVLGDEAPADPDGVGAGRDERPLEHRQVEVGARGGRAERVGDVGLAHEHGRVLGLGVERDDLDRRIARIRPVWALRSRTAWISRMAASPRFTTAMRENGRGLEPWR